MRKRLVVCANRKPRGTGIFLLIVLLVWVVAAPLEAAAAVRTVLGAVVAFIGGL